MDNVVSVNHRLHGGAIRPPTKVLIVGRTGARWLGDCMASFFSGRAGRVDCLLGFDHEDEASLYQLRVMPSVVQGSPPSDLTLVIGLDNSMIGYGQLLGTNTSLLLDTSTVTVFPEKDEIDAFGVPAYVLARKASASFLEGDDEFNCCRMASAVMLGAALAIAGEYPERRELRKLFPGFSHTPASPLVTATYEGHDWVQDRQMRAKCNLVGAVQ